MENLEISNQQESERIYLSERSKQSLKGMTVWTTFISILNFIGIAFIIMCGVIVMAMGSTFASHLGSASLTTFFGALYCVLGIVMIFPALYLYQFGQNINQALLEESTDKIDFALNRMRMYWKFIGIYTIVSLVFFFILTPIMVFAMLPTGLGI